MSKTIWLSIAWSLLVSLAAPNPSLGAEIKATVGTTMYNGGCITFIEVSGGPLKMGEFFDLRIVNKCGLPWKIRLDRDPKAQFSKRCESYGTSQEFKFENNSNLFTKADERRVGCRVEAKADKGKYKFWISESSPSSEPVRGRWRRPARGKEYDLTHVLEIEVDP